MFEELIKKLNQCELIRIWYRYIDYTELTRNIDRYNESKNALWLINDGYSNFLEHIDKIDFKNNGFIACKGDNYYYFKMEDVVDICGKYTTDGDDDDFDIIFRNNSYNKFYKEMLHLVDREKIEKLCF